ncbi:uncharacterized protein LOC135831646 [Planococcus citri]|uniref:uncharacterized protein LOC135831646 n=1 Tax=Planococcus citri TaxID=170843 RepID=UPI0031F99802
MMSQPQDVPRILLAQQLAEIQAGCTILVPRLSQDEMDKYTRRNRVRKTSTFRPIGPNHYELECDSDDDEDDDLQAEIARKRRDKPIRTISLTDSDEEVIPTQPPERNSLPPSVITEPVHDTPLAIRDESNKTVEMSSSHHSEARDASSEKSITAETSVTILNSNEITLRKKSVITSTEKVALSSHSKARETPHEPALSNPSSATATTADPANPNENALNSKSDESSKEKSAVTAVSNPNPSSSAHTLRTVPQNDDGRSFKSNLDRSISPHLVELKQRGIIVTKYIPQSKKNQKSCSTSNRGSISIGDAIDKTITSMIPETQLSNQLENLSMPSLEPVEIAAKPSGPVTVPVSSSPSNEPSCSPKIRVISGEKLGLNYVDGGNVFKQFIVDSSMDRVVDRVADDFTQILDENIGKIAVLLKTMHLSRNAYDNRQRILKRQMSNGPPTEMQRMENNLQQSTYMTTLQNQCDEIVGHLNTCVNYILIDNLMPQIFTKFCEAMGPTSVKKSTSVNMFMSLIQLILNSLSYCQSEFIRKIPRDVFVRALQNIESTSSTPRGRKRAAPISNLVPPPQICGNATPQPSKITCLENNCGPACNSTERNLPVVQSSASQNMTQRPVNPNAPIFAQGAFPAYRPNIPSTPRNSLPTMQNPASNSFGDMISRVFVEPSTRPSTPATRNRIDNALHQANIPNIANTYGAIINQPQDRENARMMVNQPNSRMSTSQGHVQFSPSNYAASVSHYRNPPPAYPQHSMNMEMAQNMMRSSDIASRPLAAEIRREIVSTTTIVHPSIPSHLAIPRHQAISARQSSQIYPNVSTHPPVSNPSIGPIHTSFPGRQNSAVYSNVQAHQFYPSHPSNPTHPASIPSYFNRYPSAVSPDMNPMLQNQRPYSPHQFTTTVSPTMQRNPSWNEFMLRSQYNVQNESSRFQTSQPSFSRHETPLSSLSTLSGEKPLSVQVVNSTLSPSAGPSPSLVHNEMPISVPIVQSSSSPNVDQICDFEGLENISTPFMKDSEFEELLKSSVQNMSMEGMDQRNVTRENH